MQYSRPLESRADLDLWAPTFLAGQFGELLLLGFAGPGASQDNAMVMEQVRAYIDTAGDQQTFFQAAHHQVQQIIQSHQLAVRAVAEALLQEETLQSEKVLAIIRSIQPGY